EVRRPRPATETARPSGATRIAQDRAVQGRREAAIAERPRGEAPREQAHLRAGTPKPLSFLQRLRIAVRIRAYVANLFKPKSPSSPEGAHARQLQASVSQKRLPSSDPKNQSAPKSAPGQPAGTTTTGTKGAAKEAGTPEMAGHLFAFDGTTGDAETQAGVADNRDAFYRLVEPNASPLSFNADAWNQVQKERSDPPHLRNTSTETTHDHRRVEARRGRGDRLTG
ncbi:MAG: hypothetical protein HYY44_06535, partial [Deltaproteobacteria bacterium]|nr:hypothetical protein [Deltaproteobacteria bacterium]